jgi:hypothetical protein
MVGSEKVIVSSEKITAQQIEHGETHIELNADELLLQQLGYKQVTNNDDNNANADDYTTNSNNKTTGFESFHLCIF